VCGLGQEGGVQRQAVDDKVVVGREGGTGGGQVIRVDIYPRLEASGHKLSSKRWGWYTESWVTFRSRGAN